MVKRRMANAGETEVRARQKEAERERRLAAAVEREDAEVEIEGPGGWWWLSFADGDLPKGQQFLGVAIVQANTIVGAARAAWRLKCNPGGQMLAVELPSEHLPGPAFRNRLLSRAEAESL